MKYIYYIEDLALLKKDIPSETTYRKHMFCFIRIINAIHKNTQNNLFVRLIYKFINLVVMNIDGFFSFGLRIKKYFILLHSSLGVELIV